jgi:hypothetical protein
MATHILTVNEDTFKIHLEYMFIGTGKNNSAHQNGALADILSIRDGDNIIFYVMNIGFFGIFKASGNVFYESHTNQYLNTELNNKTLTYRMKIEPLMVYKNYISEWNMMENPENIKDQSIYNMQWNWIFKKLNANRGCLSIDEYEFNLFKNILYQNNIVLVNTVNYSYSNKSISELNDNTILYSGNMSKLPRNEVELIKIKIEEDLRILFCAKANNNILLNQVLRPTNNGNVTFISNEAICSFSERKIDLLLGTDLNKCLLIELKNDFIFNYSIYNQLKEYARWISSYKKQYSEIIPILILKMPRILAPSRGCKYYKYLSQNEQSNNMTSAWYSEIIQEINEARQNLMREAILNLSGLQVYVFSVDANSNLVNFDIL